MVISYNEFKCVNHNANRRVLAGSRGQGPLLQDFKLIETSGGVKTSYGWPG